MDVYRTLTNKPTANIKPRITHGSIINVFFYNKTIFSLFLSLSIYTINYIGRNSIERMTSEKLNTIYDFCRIDGETILP